MEDYFFYNSITRTTIQFLDIFNDIYIERYDINGVVKGRYRVPIRYGPKSKAYLWMRDLSKTEEILPMISVYTTGIDFDPARLTNKHQDIKINTEDGEGIYAKSAVPYNISFTVNLWVLHMVDVDQIMEQILPFFGPHAYIRVRIPEIDTLFDAKVICNGCSSVMTDDVDEEEARVLKWDITYIVQTWLFKPVETKQLIGTISGFVSASAYSWTSGMGTSGFGDSGTSGKIVTRYYMDEDTFVDRDDPEKEIFVDERPSEVYAFRPIGYDEDAKLMLDYESWTGVGSPLPPAEYYTISISSSGTGTVSPSGDVEVEAGDDLTITISPSGTVYLDGEDQGMFTSYTLVDVREEHTVDVDLASQYTISVSSSGTGTVSPSGDIVVFEDEDLTITISPSGNVYLDGEDQGVFTEYTLENIQSNHDVGIGLIWNYTVSISTSGGTGTVSPSGDVEVLEGSDLVITISPSGNVYLDGEDQGIFTEYTLENVSSDHDIGINIIRYYTVDISSSGTGTVSPSGVNEVLQGSDITLTLSTSGNVYLDGADQGVFTEYTLENVQENHSINVVFIEINVEKEWIVWDYDPSDPLTSDFLTTKIFR